MSFFVPTNYKLMFSSMDCSDDDYHFWTFNWQSNENLPACGLSLQYPNFNEIVWETVNPEYFKLVTINIKGVLDRFHYGEGGYLLSPFKYYRIRKELAMNSSETKFYFPEVSLGADGQYRLGQGRHRLNALLKIYGIEEAPVKLSLID